MIKKHSPHFFILCWITLNAVIYEIIYRIFNTKCDVDVERDQSDIYITYFLLEKKNSVSKNKNIIKYWDYENNEGINPEMISRSSGKIVWWICSKCENNWQCEIRNKVKGVRCPNCGHRSNVNVRPMVTK